MRLRWGIVGLLLLAGCVDDGNFCNNPNLAGICSPGLGYSYDAASNADGGASDAAIVIALDGEVSGSGLDSGAPDADTGDGALPPAPLSLRDFCERRYARAIDWRNLFDNCCTTDDDRGVAEDVLASNFGYSLDLTPGQDSIDVCVAGVQTLPQTNVTFVGSAASACADKLAAQFPSAPAGCSATGFDAQMIEATAGHQALPPIQFPECRAAFVGALGFNASCTSSIECRAPLRCIDMNGVKTCRDALAASFACKSSSECEDGLLCITSAGSSTKLACQPAAEPIPVSVACGSSTECGVGTLCGDALTCVAPVVETICD